MNNTNNYQQMVNVIESSSYITIDARELTSFLEYLFCNSTLSVTIKPVITCGITIPDGEEIVMINDYLIELAS